MGIRRFGIRENISRASYWTLTYSRIDSNGSLIFDSIQKSIESMQPPFIRIHMYAIMTAYYFNVRVDNLRH